MNYMQEADAWLTEILTDPSFEQPSPETLENAKRQIKQKLLESYRNGQKACPKCNPRSKARNLTRPA